MVGHDAAAGETGARALECAVIVAPLDTHRIVKRLMEAGFSDAQAETVTDVVREARVSDISDLVTKADLVASEARIEARISAVEPKISSVETKISDAKADIIKWVIGLLFVQGGIVVSLIRLLPGGH